MIINFRLRGKSNELFSCRVLLNRRCLLVVTASLSAGQNEASPRGRHKERIVKAYNKNGGVRIKKKGREMTKNTPAREYLSARVRWLKRTNSPLDFKPESITVIVVAVVETRWKFDSNEDRE